MDSSRRYFVTNLHPTYLLVRVTFYCLVSSRFLLSLSVTKLRHCHDMVACGCTEIEMPYLHVVPILNRWRYSACSAVVSFSHYTAVATTPVDSNREGNDSMLTSHSCTLTTEINRAPSSIKQTTNYTDYFH